MHPRHDLAANYINLHISQQALASIVDLVSFSFFLMLASNIFSVFVNLLKMQELAS